MWTKWSLEKVTSKEKQRNGDTDSKEERGGRGFVCEAEPGCRQVRRKEEIVLHARPHEPSFLSVTPRTATVIPSVIRGGIRVEEV